MTDGTRNSDRFMSIANPLGFTYKWGMAFRVKKGEVNHTPKWYADHIRSEDASPGVRAMLLADIKLIGANLDLTLHDCERVPQYERAWNSVLSGGGILPHGMTEAIENEALAGFRPSDQYLIKPFTVLGRLMDKYDLDEKDVTGYLKWRVRQRITEERRAKRLAEEEAKAKRPHKWFTSETDKNDPNEASADDV